MRMRYSSTPVLLCGLAGGLAAQATPPRDTTHVLPTVSVTAHRAPSAILTTPLAITKVTGPALRAVNGYGLEDALTMVPGVVAQSRYGTSDIRLMIRGFGARGAGDRSNSGTTRGVRILLDGFPETEPDGRTAFDHIDLAAAEAVEVIRSNASATWGNAAGGVVNILTVPSATTPGLEFQPIFGGFGLRRYATRASMPVGNGTAFATFTNSTFDGWRQHSDARRAVLNAGVVGSVGEKTRVGVYLAAANNLMHIPGPLTQEQVDADPRQANATYLQRDERRYNRLGRLGVNLDHTIDSTTSLSTMFYVNPKYLQRSERGTYRDFTRFHLGGNVVGRKDVSLGSMKTRWTLGMDEAYQDGSIQFYTLTNNTRGALSDNKGEGANNLGFFLHSELPVTDRFNLLLGARYDAVNYYYRSFLPTAPVKFDSRKFDRVSPKFGFSWLLTPTQSVYGNIGGGIEVPAGNETDPAPGPTAPPPALLNPLLDAISSQSYELGLKSIGTRVGSTPLTLGYDVALYDTEVSNEIIPYNGGRYYATAAKARRSGLEIGGNAQTNAGFFASAALTFSKNKYLDYVVDSAVINPASAGKRTDLSDNDIVGLPSVMTNFEVGTEVPGYRALRLKAAVEHSGKYFADDFNKVTVPAFTIFNLTAELRNPIAAANGWGVRGFVTIHNVTDKKYIGSAFLNPDLVGTSPAAYEPGTPRSIIVSFSAGRLR
ncbi:MAG TPA: TonB-dependent receptor [Gemmatimonadaceae bacterium]